MKFFLLCLFCFRLFLNDVQANTDIQLSIQSSNVANVYYQIYGNERPIYDELEFVLVHEDGKHYSVKTNESILFVSQLPFGRYELKLKNKPFTYQFTIDQQYLKTQHLLKRIDLYKSHITPNTSDSSNINFYISLLGIASLFILLILYK